MTPRKDDLRNDVAETGRGCRERIHVTVEPGPGMPFTAAITAAITAAVTEPAAGPGGTRPFPGTSDPVDEQRGHARRRTDRERLNQRILGRRYTRRI